MKHVILLEALKPVECLQRREANAVRGNVSQLVEKAVTAFLSVDIPSIWKWTISHSLFLGVAAAIVSFISACLSMIGLLAVSSLLSSGLFWLSHEKGGRA